MKFYPKILCMITLLVFLPPIGLIFMYKFSPFNKKTNFAIAAACISFFVYANVTSPNSADLKLLFTGGTRKPFHLLTPEEFREKFNANSAELARQLELKIESPLETSEQTFRYEFTPHLYITGFLKENGNIDELKIFSKSENQDESFQTIVCFGLLISVFNPELSQDDRSEVFQDLKMMELVDEKNLNETTTRGKVLYSTKSGDDGEIIFAAKILDD